MRPLGVVEPQRVRDAVDDALRHAGRVASLQADVVLRGHPDQEGGLLAAQPRHPAAVAAVRRQARLLRGDPRPTGAEELPDLGTRGVAGARSGCGHVIHCTKAATGVGVTAGDPHGRDSRTLSRAGCVVDGGPSRPLTTARTHEGSLMKNAHLGDLAVSRIGLGAMTMAGTYTTGGPLDDSESVRAIHRALDLGVTHIDTAEVYGPFHSEELVGRAVKGRRDEVRIATKFGLVRHHGDTHEFGTDSSPANVRAAVEGSLRRLGTDHIDLYYQHRVDPEHADRGDGRSRRRPRRRGQGPPLRTLRGGAGHDPPRPRRTPGGRAPDRVLPVDPRRGGRDPAAPARARHRPRALLAPRARPAHRTDPHRRRLQRRRLAQDEPPLHRRQLPAQPRPRRRGHRDRRRDRRHAGPDRAGLAPHPRRRHRSHPGHAPHRPRRGEHRRRRTSSSPPTSCTGSTPSSPLPGSATTRPTWPSIDR